MVVEIKLTVDDSWESGVFQMAQPSLASYWLGKVDKVEYRILHEQSNAPPEQWLEGAWVEVGAHG